MRPSPLCSCGMQSLPHADTLHLKNALHGVASGYRSQLDGIVARNLDGLRVGESCTRSVG